MAEGGCNVKLYMNIELVVAMVEVVLHDVQSIRSQ